MHLPPPPRSATLLPAFVLAIALLGGFAVTGVRVLGALRMVPGTPVPAEVLADARLRLQSGDRSLLALLEAHPPWSELTTAQKEALYPLANRWSVLSEAQKRRWLQMAAGFHALAPEEQARLLARLTDWASLSAQQRSQARLNFAAAAAVVAPDARRARWEAYQALSDEEKRRLAVKAVKPAPTGAAPAAHPPLARKLARVPAANNAPATVPNPPKIARPVEPHVPQALPVPAPVVVETRPVEIPSARPQPLPPLPADEPQQREPVSGSMEPLHPPQ
ncbi:DUF3106 domain-containing protein [Melaminivora sp.]|uniref:DUF3106 domain-containing protein n=1 Tax=Melaminivora sp. TaxID=1933032 RepID=UPI0028B0F703|nr:DUF3106 domain-containing protein [Melaminivora sp.]